jgi:hypothetical protein
MTGSPDFTILAIPWAHGVARVAVSRAVLERAPWLPQGLEAVVSIGGKLWPGRIQLLDEAAWEAAPDDDSYFAVPEWVLVPEEGPQASKRRRRTRRGRWVGWTYETLVGRSEPDSPPEAMQVWYLADALYQQLESREMVLCDVFEREEFRDAVYHRYVAVALAPERRPWRRVAVTAWFLVGVLPVLLGNALYAVYLAGLYVALRAVLAVAPGYRPALRRHIRLRRGVRRARRRLARARGIARKIRAANARVSSG